MLLANCTLFDFGHLAEDLTGGKAWQDLVMGCDRRFRAAVAACVITPHRKWRAQEKDGSGVALTSGGPSG